MLEHAGTNTAMNQTYEESDQQIRGLDAGRWCCMIILPGNFEYGRRGVRTQAVEWYSLLDCSELLHTKVPVSVQIAAYHLHNGGRSMHVLARTSGNMKLAREVGNLLWLRNLM